VKSVARAAADAAFVAQGSPAQAAQAAGEGAAQAALARGLDIEEAAAETAEAVDTIGGTQAEICAAAAKAAVMIARERKMPFELVIKAAADAAKAADGTDVDIARAGGVAAAQMARDEGKSAEEIAEAATEGAKLAIQKTTMTVTITSSTTQTETTETRTSTSITTLESSTSTTTTTGTETTTYTTTKPNFHADNASVSAAEVTVPGELVFNMNDARTFASDPLAVSAIRKVIAITSGLPLQNVAVSVECVMGCDESPEEAAVGAPAAGANKTTVEAVGNLTAEVKPLKAEPSSLVEVKQARKLFRQEPEEKTGTESKALAGAVIVNFIMAESEEVSGETAQRLMKSVVNDDLVGYITDEYNQMAKTEPFHKHTTLVAGENFRLATRKVEQPHDKRAAHPGEDVNSSATGECYELLFTFGIENLDLEKLDDRQKSDIRSAVARGILSGWGLTAANMGRISLSEMPVQGDVVKGIRVKAEAGLPPDAPPFNSSAAYIVEGVVSVIRVLPSIEDSAAVVGPVRPERDGDSHASVTKVDCKFAHAPVPAPPSLPAHHKDKQGATVPLILIGIVVLTTLPLGLVLFAASLMSARGGAAAGGQTGAQPAN